MFAAEFNEYDAYAGTIQSVNASFLMQNLEERYWQINGLVLPAGINVQHCRSGSGAIARGVAKTDGLEFAIPAAGHFVANGQTLIGDDVLLISPSQEFLVTIPASHRWFNVFVPASCAHATRLLEDLGGIPGDARILRNRSRHDSLTSSLLARFFSNVIAAPEINDSEKAMVSFQSELLAALNAYSGYQPDRVRNCRGRAPIVNKDRVLLAVDAIEASTDATMDLSELVLVTNVSERSLRAGFQKYLGLSPTRYMQLRNLNRARQRLSTASPDQTTVASVAVDLGIWDLGRFATRYRRVYGELPSTTLRRA